MTLLWTNLKHFLVTATLLTCVLAAVALFFGVDVDIGDNRLAYKLGGEGPHIFFEQKQLLVEHIRGSRSQGFTVQRQYYPDAATLTAQVHFPLDGSNFNVQVHPDITIPATYYQDNEPILALSDVEGNFKAFRDFLIANQVIDQQLNWRFGKGHLVLVGDFVDRGFSTTQELWLIYKLEQEAKRQGGRVHFILGNHEIKNLQGNFQRAAFKYFYIAALMGKQQSELFGNDALLGRWLASKNTVELINGNLFVHGGIHPNLATLHYSLADINRIVRSHYRKVYFPRPKPSDEDVLLSTTKGASWYRGYFQDHLSQKQIDKGLAKFAAKAVVVGHTPQWRVKKLYQGKVFAIDVKQPLDYRSSFPPRQAEGLLISEGRYFRVLDNGSKERL